MPKDFVPCIFVEIRLNTSNFLLFSNGQPWKIHQTHISKQKMEIILYYIWTKINFLFQEIYRIKYKKGSLLFCNHFSIKGGLNQEKKSEFAEPLFSTLKKLVYSRTIKMYFNHYSLFHCFISELISLCCRKKMWISRNVLDSKK